MKLSRSEKTGKRYERTILRKRKSERFWSGTRADTGPHHMKEEDIVDEIYPAASATLMEERTTAMSKHGKEWLPCAPFTKRSSEI